jgi:hypothetical protein
MNYKNIIDGKYKRGKKKERKISRKLLLGLPN